MGLLAGSGSAGRLRQIAGSRHTSPCQRAPLQTLALSARSGHAQRCSRHNNKIDAQMHQPSSRPDLSVQSSAASSAEWAGTDATGGSGAGGIGSNGTGGSGGHGDGYAGGSGDGSAGALLAAASRGLDSLPTAVAAAVKDGQISADMLQRYLAMERNPFLKFFLRFGGMRERLLGDPSFPVKVAIEVGIGLTMKLLAEFQKRGKNFQAELDFVFANCCMALVADFMLTWLPAPRYTFGQAQPSRQQAGVLKWFADCPDNAFQVCPPGKSYSTAQRGGAVIRNGTKLLGVGFGSSLFGVGVTNTLLAARQLLDSDFVPPNKPQGVLATSAAYGTFMAWNSNLRYQVIAGVVEERGIEKIFASNRGLCAALSLAVRTGNTFLGSSMWIDYLRMLGFQKAPGAE